MPKSKTAFALSDILTSHETWIMAENDKFQALTGGGVSHSTQANNSHQNDSLSPHHFKATSRLLEQQRAALAAVFESELREERLRQAADVTVRMAIFDRVEFAKLRMLSVAAQELLKRVRLSKTTA